MREDLRYKKIIDGVKNDDENIWTELYERVGGFRGIKRYIKKNSGDEEDAFNVYHDALGIFQEKVKLEVFEGNSTANITSFIFSTARNLWRKKLRTRKGKQGKENELPTDLAIQLNDGGEESSPKLMVVIQCLQKLGKSCKKILIDYYYDEMSYEEIMDKHNYKDLKTTRNMKSRCLVQLRKLVENKLKAG